MSKFKGLMENIRGIMDVAANPEKEESGWGLEEGLAFTAEVLSEMSDMSEEEAIEALSEAYKWSYGVQPDETDTSDAVGTEDEPPKADIERGARIGSNKLTPSANKALLAVVSILQKSVPKPVQDLPLEDAVEMWKDALGIAVNKGKGVKWETDKVTGISYPSPDYGYVYTIWKDMIERQLGLSLTREKGEKLRAGLDKEGKRQAAILASKGVSAADKSKASMVLRGRKGKTKNDTTKK